MKKSSSWIQDYHNSWATHIILQENFTFEGIGNFPVGWRVESGDFEIKEDSDGFYLYCNTNGIISYSVDLSKYVFGGYIRNIVGDLSSDKGKYVDTSSNLSSANSHLSISIDAGQKLYQLLITKGYSVSNGQVYSSGAFIF